MFEKGRIIANPHYYDYIHAIEFQDNHAVELLDGAGQLINMIVRARYTLGDVGEECVRLTLSDFVEHHPYSQESTPLTMAPKTYTVTKEYGIFLFRCEVVWKICDELEWPCLLYHERYVFDSDPLTLAHTRQQQNLYNLLEQKDFTHSVRYYYVNTPSEAV